MFSTPVLRSLSPALLLAVAATACGGKSYPAPEPRPAVAKIVDHLRRARDNAVSFRTDSLLDYRTQGDRIKVDMPMMGKKGSRIRITALSPAGGSTLADLACDGVSFTYVDYQNNCALSGPCTKDSIKQMLRISMTPDDFLILATGGTPVIDNANGNVEWDAKHGHEVVKLIANDAQFTQTVILDGRAGFWDVLESTVFDRNGNVEWRVKNRGFKTMKADDGKTFRVPERSKLEQPKEKADVEVRWFDEREGLRREVNLELEEDLFQLAVPPGLKPCGRQP